MTHRTKESNLNINRKGEENGNQDIETPKDKFYIIYILFFFLGLVRLLPWTFFTTATKFWMYKFRNTSIHESHSEFRTPLQAKFHASMLITLQVTEVAFLFIGLLFGTYIKLRVRFIGTLSVVLTFFVVITAFVKIDTDSWQEGFFAFVMFIIAGINAMNAIFIVTLYTAVSCFPHHYLAPYITGGSLSRVCNAILQLISLATGLSVMDSALVYFSMGMFVISTTLLFVVIVTGHNKFYLHHISKYQEGHREKRVSFKEGWRLLKKMWPSVAIMFFVMFINNASPASLVVSEGEGNGPWNDLYFIPVITFLTVAICEIIGNWISFHLRPNISGWCWVIFSFVRTATVTPLLMLCNAQPRKHLPVLLPHDYQYIILQVVSSVTGGYIASLSSYNIANWVTKEELKDAYHVHMVLVGVTMGVLCFLSIVFVDLL